MNKQENIKYSEDENGFYYGDHNNGDCVSCRRIKTYLGGYVYEVTKGNLKTNEITEIKSFFSLKDAKTLLPP